ncbi:hypothetical protein [Carnimonas bestiolae]|uniref:hypothetical protein n=1 Tax=Carnimonas bestiolae TaxID=3402172 RepID=UPI003F4AF2D4
MLRHEHAARQASLQVALFKNEPTFTDPLLNRAIRKRDQRERHGTAHQIDVHVKLKPAEPEFPKEGNAYGSVRRKETFSKGRRGYLSTFLLETAKNRQKRPI